MRKVLMIFLALSLMLALDACGNSKPETQVYIKEVDWTLLNVDPSFWSNSPLQSAFVGFEISLSGTHLVANDIKEVTITAPTGISWSWPYLYDINDLFNAKDQVLAADWLYVPDYDNGSCLPIGTYTFEILLANGKSVKDSLLVPAPGKTKAGSMKYVFTENYIYADNPPADFTSLPKRATLESAIIDFVQSTLDISFSVSDGLVYSGWVALYNANNAYIGRVGTAEKLATFKDYATGEIASFINHGSAFYTDGSINIVSLKKAQLDLVEGASFEDIALVRIVLTDGQQYIGTGDTFAFDTLSISVVMSVAK